MQGILYEIIEYFQYENKDQLKCELGLNRIGHIDWIPNEKWIKYTINLKNCIRLRDLMFWIQKGLVLMSIEQILKLCRSLLIKVDELKQNKLNHFYLTSDRIWLKLNQNSKLLTISQNEIQYDIVFTGFQCPIFESDSQQQDASISILNIINQLIQDVQFAFKELPYTQQYYNCNFLSLGNHKDVFQAESEIDQLIKLYKQFPNYDPYIKEFQQHICKRSELEKYLGNYLFEIVSFSYSYESFLMENFIFGMIPMLGGCIRDNDLKELEQNSYDIYLQEQKQYWEDFIRNTFKDKTLKQLREIFEELKKQVKLEISKEDEQMMTDQILKEIKNICIFKYFFNSKWAWINQKCEDQFIKNLLPSLEQITNLRVKLWIQEMCLQFLNELI
ncbi:unnamed protein product [Paramecium octaurelia]|uniref:Uncharacterized protein n=1 Tax=Paramecium octaurelia TaxID=43137 RepID=A0A8S1TYL7_PAROT|nr:unnamed protein product [Paramecium octaurelia]